MYVCKKINCYFIFYCLLVVGQSIWTKECLTLSRPNEIAVGQTASGLKLVLASDQSHQDTVVVDIIFYYGATGFVLVEVGHWDIASSSST